MGSEMCIRDRFVVRAEAYVSKGCAQLGKEPACSLGIGDIAENRRDIAEVRTVPYRRAVFHQPLVELEGDLVLGCEHRAEIVPRSFGDRAEIAPRSRRDRAEIASRR